MTDKFQRVIVILCKDCSHDESQHCTIEESPRVTDEGCTVCDCKNKVTTKDPWNLTVIPNNCRIEGVLI